MSPCLHHQEQDCEINESSHQDFECQRTQRPSHGRAVLPNQLLHPVGNNDLMKVGWSQPLWKEWYVSHSPTRRDAHSRFADDMTRDTSSNEWLGQQHRKSSLSWDLTKDRIGASSKHASVLSPTDFTLAWAAGVGKVSGSLYFSLSRSIFTELATVSPRRQDIPSSWGQGAVHPGFSRPVWLKVKEQTDQFQQTLRLVCRP